MTSDLLLLTGGERDKPVTMSSREIAELVELRHDNVRRTIETLAARGAITLPQSEEVPNDGPGPKTISVFRVGKRDSYVIVAQLSPEFTARLVDRWQELESGAAPALNLRQPAQMLAVAMQLAEICQEQQAQLSAQAPRVAFAEAVGAAENDQKIKDVAKALGVGPRKLLAFMKDNGILMRDGLPLQHHMECGRFRVVEVPYDDPASGAKRMRLQTRVTGKGVTFLQQRLARAQEMANA